MSPEIREWSHKSRSRINNLYLITRPALYRRVLRSDALLFQIQKTTSLICTKVVKYNRFLSRLSCMQISLCIVSLISPPVDSLVFHLLPFRFIRHSTSQSAQRCHAVAKVRISRGFVPCWTCLIYTDISHISSVDFMGVKKSETWPRFSTQVAFDALWFQESDIIWNLKDTHGARMIALCPFQIWCISLYTRFREISIKKSPEKMGGKNCWIISNSATHSPNCMLMQYPGGRGMVKTHFCLNLRLRTPKF